MEVLKNVGADLIWIKACILYDQLHTVIVINIIEQPVVVLMVNSYHLQKQQGSGVLWKRSKQSPVNTAENQAWRLKNYICVHHTHKSWSVD